MKNINKWILAVSAVGLLSIANTPEAAAAEIGTPNQLAEVAVGNLDQVAELKTELKEAFPEYVSYIERADQQTQALSGTSHRSLSTLSQSEAPEVTFVETRSFDESTEYSLVLYSDGTYATVQSLAGNYYLGQGGSYSEGNYTYYYGRVLTVFHSLGYVPMIISDIAYTINWSGYDRFDNFGEGFVDGTLVYHYGSRTWESASSPAYAGYSGWVPGYGGDYQMVVELQLSSNATRVYLNGTRL